MIILLVEDNPGDARLLSEMFEEQDSGLVQTKVTLNWVDEAGSGW